MFNRLVLAQANPAPQIATAKPHLVSILPLYCDSDEPMKSIPSSTSYQEGLSKCQGFLSHRLSISSSSGLSVASASLCLYTTCGHSCLYTVHGDFFLHKDSITLACVKTRGLMHRNLGFLIHGPNV